MNPLCPVTGEPGVRQVQSIKSGSLARMWKAAHGVDARPSYGPVQRFGLWESPTGLYFFDPLTEGDHAFYTQYYDWAIRKNLWARDTIREEFLLAARHVGSNDSVLDVGCGFGSFRSVIPAQARYVGLDPNFAGDNANEGVINQSLGEHLADHAGAYDVVCAFEVIEHLANPTAMFSDMVQAARPGGLVIVGVPHVPSAFTRIPNLLMNFPPHHLTWWTKPALTALAERNGATVESIEHVPWGPFESLFYWMERCSPFKCTDIHFSNTISWHAAAIAGYLGGRLMHALWTRPKRPRATDEGSGLLMVARRN
jgi:SAM-dependent methyltransferase